MPACAGMTEEERSIWILMCCLRISMHEEQKHEEQKHEEQKHEEQKHEEHHWRIHAVHLVFGIV